MICSKKVKRDCNVNCIRKLLPAAHVVRTIDYWSYSMDAGLVLSDMRPDWSRG